jgi:tetratricopeptide (TPR) repeat protein
MKTLTGIGLLLIATVLFDSPVMARSIHETQWLASGPQSDLINVRVQPYSHFQQGIEKAIEGDFQGAIHNYGLALQESPNNADIYYNRGVAHYSAGHTTEAIQDFNQAIQINPSLAEAYGNRGAVRSVLGDRQGALQDYKQAAQLFSQQGDESAAQQMRQFIQSEFTSN